MASTEIKTLILDGNSYALNDTTARADISDLQTDVAAKANTNDLAAVAFSGNYDNLTNKPTQLSQFTDNLGSNPTHTHNSKQDTLVSGTNIKTVNGQSLLGSGNIAIQGGTGSSGSTVTANSITLSTSAQNYINVDGSNKTLRLPTSDPYSTARTPSAHSHGCLSNAGQITETETIANYFKLAVINVNDKKLVGSTISFGQNTQKYLSNAGTWEDVPTDTGGVPVQGGVGDFEFFVSQNPALLDYRNTNGKIRYCINTISEDIEIAFNVRNGGCGYVLAINNGLDDVDVVIGTVEDLEGECDVVVPSSGVTIPPNRAVEIGFCCCDLIAVFTKSEALTVVGYE